MESNEGKKRFKFLIILLLISFFLILLKLVQLTTQELFNKKIEKHELFLKEERY